MRSETRTSRATAPPASQTVAAALPTSGSGRVRGVATQKDRAEEKRREKLADMQDQIDRGELSIRQMTPEERGKNPPKRREPKKRSR
jgi:TolA-binding protein